MPQGGVLVAAEQGGFYGSVCSHNAFISSSLIGDSKVER